MKLLSSEVRRESMFPNSLRPAAGLLPVFAVSWLQYLGVDLAIVLHSVCIRVCFHTSPENKQTSHL